MRTIPIVLAVVYLFFTGNGAPVVSILPELSNPNQRIVVRDCRNPDTPCERP